MRGTVIVIWCMDEVSITKEYDPYHQLKQLKEDCEKFIHGAFIPPTLMYMLTPLIGAGALIAMHEIHCKYNFITAVVKWLKWYARKSGLT